MEIQTPHEDNKEEYKQIVVQSKSTYISGLPIVEKIKEEKDHETQAILSKKEKDNIEEEEKVTIPLSYVCCLIRLLINRQTQSINYAHKHLLKQQKPIH